MASPQIQAILILDGNDGSRLHVKYFTKALGDFNSQVSLEKRIHNKAKSMGVKSDTEIMLLDNTIVVYKRTHDSGFYVVGSYRENELILGEVLIGLYESLAAILRQQLDKKSLLMSLDVVLLAVDEIVDGGLILETDPLAITNRVLMRNAEPVDTNIGDMTVSEAFSHAKNSFLKSWMS